MANGNNRQWLEQKFAELEQALRANVAAVWARLVTMVQNAEKKVEGLQERLQSHEIRLTAVERRLGEEESERLEGIEARLASVERKTAWMPEKSDTGRLRALDQAAARKAGKLIDQHFDEGELRELCLDFHLVYENVEGDTKQEKAHNLAMYFYRRKTLDVFINWLKGQRPRVEWPDVGIGDS